MTATVKIMPGAIVVINEDPFPWYGLIITVEDRYSTKYRFDDPNWGFLAEDSVLEPNEEVGPPINAFIDSSGNEYEGRLYTIIAAGITLEAKTSVDGQYDLRATFEFSVDDPIIDNGVWRTNKPDTPEASAFERLDTRFATYPTPYVLSEKPERRPTIHIYTDENTYRTEYIEHHEEYYEEIKVFVSGYPQNAFGSYELPADVYEAMVIRFNLDVPYFPTNEADLARWKEQWTHWEKIDAFRESVQNVMDDQIIDEEESKHICFALDQWTTQMSAARDYVQDYRRDDPETVQKNPGLGNLEHEVERALELLNQVECQ